MEAVGRHKMEDILLQTWACKFRGEALAPGFSNDQAFKNA